MHVRKGWTVYDDQDCSSACEQLERLRPHLLLASSMKTTKSHMRFLVRELIRTQRDRGGKFVLELSLEHNSGARTRHVWCDCPKVVTACQITATPLRLICHLPQIRTPRGNLVACITIFQISLSELRLRHVDGQEHLCFSDSPFGLHPTLTVRCSH